MVFNLSIYRKTRKANESILYGEWVSIARKNQGLTQKGLGDKIGYSQSIVSRMESGKLEFSPDDAANTGVALNNNGLLKRYCQGCPVYRALRIIGQLNPKPAA